MCPLDVAKTRLQNQGKRVPLEYVGTFGTLGTIWKNEGIRGLYHGLSPTLLGYLPNWAIYFAFYDLVRRAIAERHPSYGTLA